MITFLKRARVLRGQEGAAVVEFALVISILLIVVFGIIEFGRAYSELEVMNSAAREGARAAAVGDTDAQAAISNAAEPYTPDFGGYSMTPAGGCVEQGEPVTVAWTQNIEISIVFLPSMTKEVAIRGVFRCEVGAE